MDNKLTLRQKQVLDFISDKITSEKIAPTIREIAGFFGFSSTGTVRDHLQALSRKGYLKLNRNKARALELDVRTGGLAIVGRVACGKPQFAQEDIEGYLQPEEIFRRGRDFFCLRATGDSMEEAGIIKGDLLVVRRQSQAQDGEIVVALIGDEATVKFLRRRHNRYYLEPANRKYRPVAFTESTSVIGKVVSVVRNYV